jgi:hypothetical protein
MDLLKSTDFPLDAKDNDEPAFRQMFHHDNVKSYS